MKKTVLFILLFSLFLNSCASVNASSKNINFTDKYYVTMKQDLFCLMLAYPEYITNIESKEDGNIYLIMKSGKKILYDDKKEKTFSEKLANPDLQDMLEQIYPLSPIRSVMDENFDPGRSRVYSLFSEVYGCSKQSIESNLMNVNLGYKNCQFNKSNNAANNLQATMKELIPLAQKKQAIQNCVFPCSGTYNYRVIAGTNQLSPHSFGIAIDLAVNKKDYWKWSSKADGDKRLSTYPNEIAEVFEKNNFIWGGKWGHFDIMHFEYRPEIILKARYFKENQESKKFWYDGLPLEEVSIKNIIDKIDATLK